MPSILRTCLASPPVTWASLASRRVRTLDFFSRMWDRKALRRMILPVPVILKRLAAPRSVFILGIGGLLRLLLGGGGCCGVAGAVGLGGLGRRLRSLVRCQHHDHVAAVELRGRLHL